MKLIINDDHYFSFNKKSDQILLNNFPISFNLIKSEENFLHIIKDNKVYSVQLIEFNDEDKTLYLKINNKECKVLYKEPLDELLEKLGMENSLSSGLSTLKAPMPGLIKQIMVAEGQQVEKGTHLIILEAMKMENIIKANGEGTINKINVEEGEVVEKNMLLITF